MHPEFINDWKQLMHSSVNSLNALNDFEASAKLLPHQWSKKEILGHLCDSAINNYTRVIKIQLCKSVYIMERYAQNEWVRLADYQTRDWLDIINLWLSLNNSFIAVVENTPENSLMHIADFEGQSLSLEFIITDYIDHMKHHLNQILTLNKSELLKSV